MPEFAQRGFVHLLVVLLIFLGIAVGVYLVTSGRFTLFPKASGENLVLVDKNHQPIQYATSRTIRIRVTQPDYNTFYRSDATTPGFFDFFNNFNLNNFNFFDLISGKASAKECEDDCSGDDSGTARTAPTNVGLDEAERKRQDEAAHDSEDTTDTEQGGDSGSGGWEPDGSQTGDASNNSSSSSLQGGGVGAGNSAQSTNTNVVNQGDCGSSVCRDEGGGSSSGGGWEPNSGSTGTPTGTTGGGNSSSSSSGGGEGTQPSPKSKPTAAPTARPATIPDCPLNSSCASTKNGDGKTVVSTAPGPGQKNLNKGEPSSSYFTNMAAISGNGVTDPSTGVRDEITSNASSVINEVMTAGDGIKYEQP